MRKAYLLFLSNVLLGIVLNLPMRPTAFLGDAILALGQTKVKCIGPNLIAPHFLGVGFTRGPAGMPGNEQLEGAGHPLVLNRPIDPILEVPL